MSAPVPGSAEWQSKVTASKVAAILGLSPWDSPYSIWRKMRGDIPGDTETEAMRRGNMLENAVLDWWLQDNPHVIERARQHWYPVGEWAGATPDLDITEGDDLVLVDAKTISDDSEWQDGPPPHYLASSLWQLACAPDAARVHLAVLFGRPFALRTFTVERDPGLIESIVTRCREFYDSLAFEDPPPLDDTVATYEAIRKEHPDIDRDLEVQVDAALAHEYVQAELDHKDAEVRARATKTALLAEMGRARIAKHDNQIIARRQPNKTGVSLVRVAKNPPAEGVAA